MACSTLVVILACTAGVFDLLTFVLLISSLMNMRARKNKSRKKKAPKQNEPKSFSESALARLPPELRVLIFQHYFQAHTYILDPLRESRPPARLPPPPLSSIYYSNVTSLLRTCSQFNHEAAPLIIANTNFKTFLRYDSIYDFLLNPPVAPNGTIEHLIIHYRNLANMRLAPIVRALPDLETIVVCGDTRVIRRTELPHAFNKRRGKVVTEADFVAMLNSMAPLDIDSERSVKTVLQLARKPLSIELVFHVGITNNGDVAVYRPVEKTWVRKHLDVATQVEYGFDEGRYHIPYGRVGRR